MIDHGKVFAHVRVDNGVDNQLSGELALFSANVSEDVCVWVPDVFDGERRRNVS